MKKFGFKTLAILKKFLAIIEKTQGLRAATNKLKDFSDITEWLEQDFIEVAVKMGTESDLVKVSLFCLGGKPQHQIT